MKKLTILLVFVTAWSADVQAQDNQLIAEGAGVWAVNCTRCHSARSPLERNASDWKTIVNHMRVRANLTKSEATSVIAYFNAIAPKSASSKTKEDAQFAYLKSVKTRVQPKPGKQRVPENK